MTELARIPLAGVIGDPIAHSRSPALHGYWLQRYGLKGHYVPLHIAQQDLQQALEVLPKLGFVGANVTIPHKEAVLKLADVVTDRAALIGAANTLIFRADGRLHADNTDGTRHRAEALRADFGAKLVVVDWVQAPSMLEGAATVVNTTSLGMAGKSDFRVPLDALEKSALVTDLVYTPLQTQFLIDAAAKGCTTVDGLGMLLHQAAPGFERWFGHRPEVDAATRQAVLSA